MIGLLISLALIFWLLRRISRTRNRRAGLIATAPTFAVEPPHKRHHRPHHEEL